MAPKNLVSRKRRPPPDEVRTLGNKQSDEDTDSVSDSPDGGAAEECAEPLVPPKKPKFITPLKRPVPEPVENGSPCSSPSASGFIIAPSQKPQAAEKKTAKKKASASKVFSEDDVISLLKGLAVFWADGKNNRWADFHLFVKDDLGNQFTKTQVSEKIRNLKRKFDAYSKKAKANGCRIDISDPHESAVFELSNALWGEENVQMVENGDEEANELSTEKEKEEMVEKDEGSKKRKKRKKQKQVTENGEENEKSKKAEQGAEELLEEGDVRDAANTILSIRKLVDGNGEGNKKAKKKKKKKKKKTKQGDELDEKKELVVEEVQVEGNDEGNKISSKEEQFDGVSERNKKKTKKAKKMKLVDECCEEKTPIGEQKEADEHAEKSLKEADHRDEEAKEEKLLKEGKQADEHEQEEKTSKKNKQVDGREKKKGTTKEVDGHSEENSIPAKEEQKMEIGVDEFQSAYPLLYASFNSSEYPKVAMDTCARIGRDNAQELEEKLREIHITKHRLELKRLDLISRQRK